MTASRHEPCGSALVHLVRHAEVHNPEGVLYGRASGFPLSEAGEQMAFDVAQQLAGRDVVAVWSSPMERTLQTATAIAREHNLPVWLDVRLIEAASLLEGTHATLERSVLLQPRVWPRLWNPWRPSWGEPYREVASRMRAAVLDAAADAAGREVVLVSHQMPIWVLRRQVEGRPLPHHPRRRQCALASVTTMTVRDGEVVDTSYAASPPAGVRPT